MTISATPCLATDVVVGIGVMGIGVIAGFAFLFSLRMRLPERWLVPWKGRA